MPGAGKAQQHEKSARLMMAQGSGRKPTLASGPRTVGMYSVGGRASGQGAGGPTELFVPLGRDLQDNPLDQELQVAEEDEGGRCWRPAMVLLNQVMALELPDLVCVFLHFLECVAGRRQRYRYQNVCGTQHSGVKCLAQPEQVNGK